MSHTEQYSFSVVRPWKNRTRRGFTIVELIVVIAIIAIVTAIGIPAFQGIGKGSSMQASINNLRSTILLARQWAITHHETTYVVFPDDANIYNGNEEMVSLAFRGYNVYTKSEGYVSEWRSLPQGILFIRDNTYNAIVSDAKSPFANVAKYEDLGFPDTNTIRTVPAIGFRPDGRPVNMTATEIYLGEGFLTVNTDSGTVDDYDFSPNTPVFSINIYGTTGLIRNRNYQDFL